MNRQTESDIIDAYKIRKCALSVANDFSIAEATVLKIMHNHGIPVYGNKKRDHLIEEAIQYYQDYPILSATLNKYGFSKSYFMKLLDERGIPVQNLNRSIIKNEKYYKLYTEYEAALSIYNQRSVIADVAKVYDIPTSGVRSVLKLHGIILQKKRKQSLVKSKAKKDIIICDYNNGLSIGELKVKYDVSVYYIRKTLTDNGVTIRSKRLSIQMRNKDETNLRNKLNRSYRSKKYTLPSGKIIFVQGYEDHFLDFIFYNNILNETEIEYDAPRIQYIADNKERFYYPDFFIPKFNLQVEIKSLYTFKRTRAEKFDAAKKSQYDYIVIIDKDYTDFINKISN
jgi:hypothetical protein